MPHAPHPEMAPILAEMRANPQPDYTAMPIAQARILAEEAAMANNRNLPPMEVQEITLGGRACKLLNPGGGPGVVVSVHGGGWTFGSPASHESFGRQLALDTGMPVLLPSYRLAPEYPCPAAIDDILAVIKEFKPGRYALLGHSAGATIALSAQIGGAGAAMLGLAYGCFAPVFDTDSHREYGNGQFGLTTERMQWFWDNWEGREPDPRSAPLYSELEDLPPVHLLAAGLDCLRDDSLLMAARLADAGVDCRLDIVPGVVHGFLAMTGRLAPARAAIATMAAEIRRTLLD